MMLDKMSFLTDLAFKWKILRYKINYVILCAMSKTQISGHCCVKDVTVIDKGKNNTILTGRHVVLENCSFYFQGDNHKVILGDNIHIENVSFFFEKDNATIEIGSSTWIGSQCQLTAMAGTTLKIGSGTLLAPQCIVRTSDSHYIYHNGIEINPPQDIVIGNHCWLGEQVFVLKGAIIADGCIVGARSVVTSKSTNEANTLLVGTPAKVVKREITWSL